MSLEGLRGAILDGRCKNDGLKFDTTLPDSKKLNCSTPLGPRHSILDEKMFQRKWLEVTNNKLVPGRLGLLRHLVRSNNHTSLTMGRNDC